MARLHWTRILKLYAAGFTIKEIEKIDGERSRRQVDYVVGFHKVERHGRQPQRLPASEFDKVKYLYVEEKLSATRIGEILGLSETAVLYRLHRSRVQMRPADGSHGKGKRRKPLPPWVQEAGQYYHSEEQPTMRDVADRYGVSVSTLHRWFRIENIKTRPRGLKSNLPHLTRS